MNRNHHLDSSDRGNHTFPASYLSSIILRRSIGYGKDILPYARQAAIEIRTRAIQSLNGSNCLDSELKSEHPNTSCGKCDPEFRFQTVEGWEMLKGR